jgi:tetratricopeptide (TPR) repeat protein
LDRYRLLNDRPNEALALHNLGEAKQQLGELKAAHSLLESAAAINAALKLDGPWWRDQITLLQVEAQSDNTNQLAIRFEKLIPRSKSLANGYVKALFVNELGLWHTRAGDLDAARTDFAEALQLFRSAHDDSGAATVLANQALLLEKEKKFRDAAELWRAAQQQFELLPEPTGIAISMAGRGRALLNAQTDLPVAEDLLRRAARNFRLLRADQQAKETAELLKQSLAAQGKSAADTDL